MVTTNKKIAAAKPVKVAVPPAAPKVAPTPAAPVVVAKNATKAAAKPVARRSPLVATTLAKPFTPPKMEKPAKAKKPKLVRDSFTIPKAEYTVLDDLKQRAGKLLSPAKKSELIRAGVKALAAMSDTAFLAALKAVPAIKTGRPAKD